MKRIILKTDGTFKHWHTHQDVSETIEVANEVAMELSQNTDTKKYDIDSKAVLAVDNTPPFILDSAKEAKSSEINAASTAALSTITNQYTRAEIDSWPVQESEANAWINDNAAATPLLDGIVANRPSLVDKSDLVNRVLTNAANYKALSGIIIGKKQAYQDQIDALPVNATQVDIDAIEVTF